MKFSLSTNWCNTRIASGAAIVEKALSLGFSELELGFHTTAGQAKEIAALRDRLPVGSVHAFCPVPLSAPQGYPELYLLADADEETRKMAQLQIRRNIAFAASVGADALVLHAGRIPCGGLFRRWEMRRRVRRGRKMLDVFKRELAGLLPELEKNRVTLGLENLPYLEGFPAEWEIGEVVGDWVKPWLDTGHDFVRRTNGWPSAAHELLKDAASFGAIQPVGLHVHDSRGGDDHLAPGEGLVDFVSLRTAAERARHVVFEPSPRVGEDALRRGIAHLKKVWKLT